MNLHLERIATVPMKFLDRLETKKKLKLYTKIKGHFVKMGSQRYAVFQKTRVCAHCGLVGTTLAVERDVLLDSSACHINMYGYKDGREILFTKDHIHPKSKGGKNHLSNYQTMCVECNNEKGNKVP